MFFRAAGEPAFVLRRQLLIDGTGDWSTSFVATRDERYFVGSSADATTGPSGVTLIAPTIRGPGLPSYLARSTIVARGTAGAGAVVTLHFDRAGTAIGRYKVARQVRANSAGAWSRAFVLTESTSFYATVGSLRTSVITVRAIPRPVVTLRSTPASVRYHSKVVLAGTAPPGSIVVFHFHDNRSAAYIGRLQVRAGRAGTYSTSYIATRDERYYATDSQASGRPSRLTRITPTINSPSAAYRGALVTVRGSAGIGSLVAVRFHRQSTPASSDVSRQVRTNSAGTWTKQFRLDTAYTVFASIGATRTRTVVFAVKPRPAPPAPPVDANSTHASGDANPARADEQLHCSAFR